MKATAKRTGRDCEKCGETVDRYKGYAECQATKRVWHFACVETEREGARD